jgi:hypothetical protein
VMTKAAMESIIGGWLGAVTAGGNTITIVFNFSRNPKGELVGTFGIPDQGLVDSPVTDLEFDGNKLSLLVPRLQGAYAASFAASQFSGNLKLGGPGVPPDGLPLVLKRGEYAAKVYPLKLSTESFAAMNGTWAGKLELTSPQGQSVSLAILLRFGTSDNGQYVGFLDSPDQKAKNIPITEASFANGKLSVKVDAVKGEYNGSLSGKTLTGEWTQGGKGIPLSLTHQ